MKYARISTESEHDVDSVEFNENDRVFNIKNRSLVAEVWTRVLEAISSPAVVSFYKRWKSVFMAWICMILAIISGSAIGPMFKYMETTGVPPFLAASWRCQTMIIFLWPISFIETKFAEVEQVSLLSRQPDLEYPVYVHVLIGCIAWCFNLLTWIYSLQYTTTVRASLVASLHPLFLVFVIYFSGGSVSRYEWLGVVLSIAGLCVVGSDGFGDTGGKAMHRVLFGDALNLVAAMAQVVVILNRRRIQSAIPLMQVSPHSYVYILV